MGAQNRMPYAPVDCGSAKTAFQHCMLLKINELTLLEKPTLSPLFSTGLPCPLQANPQSPHLQAVCLICYSCAV